MNYGRFAGSYQFLSRLVFGNALIRAQQEALDGLTSPCNLMIAGGGDGEILKHLSGLQGELDYVEISEKMVNKAKSKTARAVHWYTEDIFSFKTHRKYDVIFLPFLLDNFTTGQCTMLMPRIHHMLKENGQLIVVDFTENPSLIQKGLLQLMYSFFKRFGALEVRSLPAMEESILSAGFSKTGTVRNFHGFIETKRFSLLVSSSVYHNISWPHTPPGSVQP